VAGAPIPPQRAVRVVAAVDHTTDSVNDHRYYNCRRRRTLRDATKATGRGSDAGDDSVQLVAVSPAVRPTVRSPRVSRHSAKLLSPRTSVIVVVVGYCRACTVHTRDDVVLVKVRRRAIPVGGRQDKR